MISESEPSGDDPDLGQSKKLKSGRREKRRKEEKTRPVRYDSKSKRRRKESKRRTDSSDDSLDSPRLVHVHSSGCVRRHTELSKEDAEFLHVEAELARGVCEKNSGGVVRDAADLMQHLADVYSSVSQSFQKPNVLVTGITGSGKSTLINSMFGKEVAATGTGVPITQHFTKYNSPDMKTIIYDSKGLEHGHYEEFIETTTAFFKDHESGSSDGIHVVWYVVNTGHARVEAFERELCTRLFSNIPIFFLLNKADISTQNDREQLRKVIRDMELPNCCGIFDVIADSSTKLKNCDSCPKCSSDDVTVKLKSAVMICEDCGHKESLVMEHGLEAVVRATLMVLPDVVKENFVAAQNVSFALKEEMSRGVLTEFWGDFSTPCYQKDLLKVISRMISRLSTVWEFTGHGDEIATLLASDLVSTLKWKKKSFLWSRKKVIPSESQRIHVTSLGILWNWCLRELAQQLLHVWEGEIETSGGSGLLEGNCLNNTCTTLFREVFSAMHEENLKNIEGELKMSQDIREVLSNHSTTYKISSDSD